MVRILHPPGVVHISFFPVSIHFVPSALDQEPAVSILQQDTTVNAVHKCQEKIFHCDTLFSCFSHPLEHQVLKRAILLPEEVPDVAPYCHCLSSRPCHRPQHPLDLNLPFWSHSGSRSTCQNCHQYRKSRFQSLRANWGSPVSAHPSSHCYWQGRSKYGKKILLHKWLLDLAGACQKWFKLGSVC